MRTNMTSGFSIAFCVSVCALMILLSMGDGAYAKRGCMSFGHSCFGGHGKRFAPQVREDMMQNNELMTNEKSQEQEPSRLSNELFLRGVEPRFQGQDGRALSEPRRQGSQRFDPYALSLFVGQWLASHRRVHHPDLEVNNK